MTRGEVAVLLVLLGASSIACGVALRVADRDNRFARAYRTALSYRGPMVPPGWPFAFMPVGLAAILLGGGLALGPLAGAVTLVVAFGLGLLGLVWTRHPPDALKPSSYRGIEAIDPHQALGGWDRFLYVFWLIVITVGMVCTVALIAAGGLAPT